MNPTPFSYERPALATKYFTVNATTPAIFIYRSWYDDGFLLNVNGHTLRGYPSFLSINAYLLGKNIASPITGVLVYYPQKLAETGLLINLISLSLNIIAMVFPIKKVKQVT